MPNDSEVPLVSSAHRAALHALWLSTENLRPGTSFVACGLDTLEEVIGIRDSVGSLRNMGWSTVRWTCFEDGSFDYEGIAAINKRKGQTGDHTAFQRVRHPSHIVCEAD